MQTFLPYPSFVESAKALDRQRLGKQRVEVLQLLKTLHEGGGWSNHPAVRMWCGGEGSLIRYGLAVCYEWKGRGYKDTCTDKIAAYAGIFPCYERDPEWLGDEAFHRAHQSNLVRKLPDHYGPLFPGVPDDLPYVWPAAATSTNGQLRYLPLTNLSK
jgi:hypothetical protein